MRFPLVFNTSIEYDEEYLSSAYTDPCVREKDPIVWCCKDPLGVSKQQIQEARSNGLDVRDDFTRYDEKGKVIFTYNPPDYEPEAKNDELASFFTSIFFFDFFSLMHT